VLQGFEDDEAEPGSRGHTPLASVGMDGRHEIGRRSEMDVTVEAGGWLGFRSLHGRNLYFDS
jgi:hypothetical protein